MSGSLVDLCLCDTPLCNGNAINEFGEAEVDDEGFEGGLMDAKYAKEGAYGDEDGRFGLVDTYGKYYDLVK